MVYGTLPHALTFHIHNPITLLVFVSVAFDQRIPLAPLALRPLEALLHPVAQVEVSEAVLMAED